MDLDPPVDYRTNVIYASFWPQRAEATEASEAEVIDLTLYKAYKIMYDIEEEYLRYKLSCFFT